MSRPFGKDVIRDLGLAFTILSWHRYELFLSLSASFDTQSFLNKARPIGPQGVDFVAATATVTMDIVLEFFDTFAFDALWATLLPTKNPAYSPTATSSVREIPTALPPTTWQYVPASDYLSFTPRKYAYMSQWLRDDWRRQLITLFLITWCVAHALHPIRLKTLLTTPLGSSPSSSTSFSPPCPTSSSSIKLPAIIPST